MVVLLLAVASRLVCRCFMAQPSCVNRARASTLHFELLCMPKAWPALVAHMRARPSRAHCCDHEHYICLLDLTDTSPSAHIARILLTLVKLNLRRLVLSGVNPEFAGIYIATSSSDLAAGTYVGPCLIQPRFHQCRRVPKFRNH